MCYEKKKKKRKPEKLFTCLSGAIFRRDYFLLIWRIKMKLETSHNKEKCRGLDGCHNNRKGKAAVLS